MTAARRSPVAPARIAAAPRDRPLALSFAQQRLWFLAQLDPRGCSLNAPFVLALHGELDLAALRRALCEIVRRHDALRTTFADDAGVPVQRVTAAAEIEVALPLDDLTALADDERAAAAERLERREFLTGFDLETGPVFRVRLVRMAADDHRLLFVAHHLVWDGWSFVVFVRELGAIYGSLAGGAAPALPPVVQYPDFAQWQRAALDEAALAPHRAYWLDRLAGAPPALELQTDRPRPAALSLRGGRVRQHLPAELAGSLRALARSHGVTLFMALSAGLAALLCRYTGCEDLVIGTVIGGRTRRELESVLGMFVNTVPLRIDCAGDPSFATLLGRVRRTCIEAFAHQDMPFEQLVEQLAPARDPGRMPLFQVLVAQHPAWPVLELPGLSVRTDDADYGSSMFDLSLYVQDTATTVRATWELSTALFDEATIRRMHAHWTQLLAAALAEPDRPISQLAMVTDAERDMLLAQGTVRASYPAHDSLHALFEAQVARTPGRTAVVFGDERLTYAALDARANRLARHLAARGVGREDRVGVCLGRSIDFVVSVVAAIKAGACYVPLDPSYPAERLAYMAADAGVRVVIARRGVGIEAGAPVWLDEIEAELSQLAGANLPVIATGGDLAYVMYTSGSTGQPKGTCIEQRSVARLVLGTDYVQLGPGDVVGHLSNTSFDAATFEIWGALLNGATLYGIAPEVVMSAEELARALADGGITAMFITAALFDQVAAVAPDAFRAVHHLIVGGDVVDAAAVRRVLAAGPPRRLLNGYGPTETTTFAICHLIGEVDDRAQAIPIGRPIANTTVRILDRHRNLVPVGVRGEIYLGGAGVARGYWNRPELTAERFVDDPFEPGGRLYRTGDLAAWRSDGVIEFHGRADHQIKLRGFRIELGEIEAQLMACAELAAATVVVRDERLVAYAVPRAGAALDLDAAAARLAAVLPRYMLPSAIVALDRLPMTPNGKIDRAALPAPATRHEASMAPRSAMEEIVGEIWQRVLDQASIGAQDSFFALGGHSLLAMQVVSRIRTVLGIAVPVHRLFEAPTLAAFARDVQAAMAGGEASSVTTLGPVPRPATLPLSFAQQRLWFIDRLEPGGFSYNVPVFVRLTGPLRIDVLARSLDEIAGRHEVLRTRFVEAGGAPAQVIAPAPAATHALEVDRIAADADPARSLEAWAVDEARRPFSLADGPLVRAKLLALGPDDHVLGLTMHHIVCDAWSIGLVMRELQALYRARLDGTEPVLPALPLQYADFAIRQRALPDEALAGQLAYWTEQLAGAPDRIELPADRARPAVHTTRGAIVHHRLTPEVTAAARELGKRSGVTLFMTLLAGYYALLHRYSGQPDLVVGSPITGRHHPELEDLIGFFVNTVALRVRIDRDTSFDGLLASVRDACLRAHANQDVAFDRVVEAIRPVRDPSYMPLFQVMFVLQNPPAPLALPGLAADNLWVHPGAAKFDLTLYVEEAGDAIRTHWEYNTDLFDAATIERIAGHYGALLEAAIARPERRLGALPLLSEAERRMIVEDWNATRTAPARQASVVELFEDQVRRTPDAIAVVDGQVELSYRVLDARAAQWAAVLRARGCGPGVRVALALSRSQAFPVAVLAVLKAGAAYVPLDLSYPAERLAFMLRDCEARVLVTEAAVAPGLPASAAELVLVDALATLPTCPTSGGISGAAPAPDDLAYVLYTSGSTGRPKGVAMPHGAVRNLVSWQCARSPVPARTLQFAALSFDVSFQELFATWANGGCLVLASDEARRDPVELLRTCRDQRIERLFLPFVALHQLAEAAHGGDLGDLRLREVITAGEQLRITPAIAALFSQLPACRLYNQYGPTETHVVTEHALTGAPASWQALPPIGRPIANVRVHVLDDDLQPTPIGVAGELYLAGAGVACGYLGRAELTSERFVPDPSGVPGARMYRTGDRAKYLPGGDLVFLGRADDQVKLRGYRVELGEIEAALGSHPAVSEAAVVARSEAGDTRLIAYVAWRDGAATSAAELKIHLRARLPEYMAPAVIVALPALPLTPSGKLDRRALPGPDVERAVHAAPRTAMEEVVANVWAPVLGVGSLGTTDNFFEAGGHSLLATQVVSRLGAALGVAIPVRTLFEAPTIAELARRLEALVGGARVALPAIERASRAEPLPLSYAQQRLWFIEQLDPGGFTYNVPLFLRLTGALDVAALEASLRALVLRHEVLRTRFAEIDGEPRQVIAADLDVALAIEPVLDGEVAERAQREAQRPFDLEAGPLLRARLLRVRDDDHVLLLAMHHIVCDGWSMAILVRELGAAYLAAVTGAQPELPELAVQYADFARWQRRWLTGEVLDTQLAYWQRALAGAPPALELPTDRPRPARRTAHGAQLTRVLGGELVTALRALSRKEGATEFMTLLAAFDALLARYSGQHDIVVGSAIAGRNRAELEGLIGFFVNTLVLRVDTAGAPSFRELVGRVREVCLGAYAHQDLPFDKLVEVCRPERELNRTPLFQVMFALQNAPTAGLDVAGLAAGPVDLHSGIAKFDLSLFVLDGPAGIVTTWEYSTDLFDEATIERMAMHYASLLERLIADPDRPISQLAMVTDAERDQLLAQGTVRASHPAHDSLHALFEAQVARTPGATAVVFGDQRLTYAALDARANRLARHLVARGVGREDRVGVCLGRSIDFVVSVVAAIKAGACYVPLDPSYPVERLAYMAADAGVRVVIARRGAGIEAGVPVWLDELEAELSQLADDHLPVIATGGDLAYVMYTSGSTGQPKGTCIEQRSIACLVLGTDYLQLGLEDVVTHLSNTSFDAATFEIWGPLLNGATLYGIAPEVVVSPEELARVVADGGITTMFVTTALFHQLAAVAPAMFRTVDHVLFGGELLDAGAVRRVLAADPPRRLMHMYGPTETTTFATWQLIGEVDDRATTIPIGRPIAGTTVRILDPHRNLVPVGVRGEIYLGGAGVARGYWNRPELTAERFVADPFEPGGRLYRTGDLAAWRSDGAIEFHGRADHQVKLRGFRIELGEIEAQLMACAELAAATVMVRDDTGDPRLVAYVVPRAGAGLDLDAVRARLAAVLPRHMLPSAIVALDRLPMTPNGKIDRAALPAPSARRELGTAPRTAPRTAMEEIIGEIWQRVLEQDAIGAQDSFFALGGHSLLAMQVLSRIRGVLGISVPVHRLFEAPTLAAFARAVEATMAGGAVSSGASGAAFRPVHRPARLPLSFAQQRLWFLDRLEPGGFSYNVPVFVRLTGPLRIDVLAHGVDEIVRRHEVLRTRFIDAGGAPEQVIAPASAVAHVLEVDQLPAGSDASSGLDAWAVHEARRPFSLADGPLIRAKLLAVGPDHHVLGLMMHHIVCDGWSLGLVMRELQALYRAGLAGTEPALPALALQYADFAIRQRELSEEILPGQLAYWTEQLAGAPDRIELPTDRARPAVHTTRGALVHRRFTPAVTAAARELSKRSGVTLFMTLLAGYHALLHRYSGQHDIVVGSPIAGRHHEEVEDLIGFFVNSLALRVRIDDDASFDGLLASVRDVCLRAQANQDVPFERVVEAVRPVRDASYTPLFQVMFVLQDPPVSLELPGITGEGLIVHPGMAKVDLTLYVQDAGDELRASWEYNTDLFDEATIERMAAHYASLLERLLEDPAQRPSAVPLVSAAERDQLLAQGTVRASYPAHDSLHALFEAQVARTPGKAAVVFGDERLTYAALDARSNRLARHLVACGVGREDRVGVCLGRSIDFVVSVVAAIKAGACYVPLDPSYPVERLAYMAADAGVRVVIARRETDLSGMTGAPIWLDAIEAELAQLPDANLPVIATGRDLGYVMYTSGSTGQPKGTCIEQRSIVRLVVGTDYVQLGGNDVVAHLSNTSFDAATFEIWGALLNGATLHGIAPDVVISPEAFARAVADGGITAMLVTTAVFHQLAAAAPAMFRTVDHVLFGGDVIDAAALRRVLAAGPPRRLINAYGPTEITTIATWHLVGEIDDRATTIPIGRPIANTTVRILDGHRNLVPVGVRGELYLGGPGVARGYWNRPELTAERFVDDPFEPGGRLYRTGDLAAWRSNGAIEFHGRADHQIKLRGFRIELGEIEAQLMASAELAAATVVVRDDAGDPRLVAYVVPRGGAGLDLDAVRARLAAVLPRHMLPSAIVALDRLPMTPNGKIDRRALPAPSARRADLGGGYLAPEGDLEQAISRIWADVLGVDRIGANDNFFDLGGSSLLIVSVQSRIEALLGRPVPVAVLFQHAQVRSLSAHLAGLGREPSRDPEGPAHRTAGARRLADQRRGRPARS